MSAEGPIRTRPSVSIARKQAEVQTSRKSVAGQALAVQRAVNAPGTSVAGFNARSIQQNRPYNPSHFFGEAGMQGGLSSAPAVQTSIPMGKPGDKYEQEADATADKVMQMPENQVAAKPDGGADDGPPQVSMSSLAQGISPVSRKEDVEAEAQPAVATMPVQRADDEAVQGKCEACANEEKAPGVQQYAIQATEAGPDRNKDPVQAESLISRKDDEAAPAAQASFVSRAEEEVQQMPLVSRAEEEAAPKLQASFVSRMDAGAEHNKDPVQKAEAEEVQQTSEEAAQPKCVQCADEEAAAKEEEQVNKSDAGASASGSVPAHVESGIRSSKGSGSPLPGDTRERMESSFGADFSNVRVHTDGGADRMNKDIGAQAFAHGSDIYFGAGKFDTNSSAGKHLLAHELTHTIQQGAAPTVSRRATTSGRAPPVSRTGGKSVQGGWLSSIGNGLKSAGNWVKDKVVSGAEATWDGIKWVGGKIGDGVMWLYEKAKKLINGGTDWLKSKWNTLKGFATGGWGKLKEFFGRIVSMFTAPLRAVSDAIENMDEKAIRKGWDTFTGKVKSIWNSFEQMTMLLMSTVEAAWGGITGFVDGLFRRIKDITGHWAFRLLPGPIQDLIKLLISGVESLWQGIRDAFASIGKGIKAFIEDALKKGREFLNRILSFAIDVIINGIILFGKLVKWLLDFVRNPKKHLNALANKCARHFKGVDKGFESQVTQYFGEPRGRSPPAPAGEMVQKTPEDGAERRTASFGEIGTGIWDGMKMKWAEFMKNPGQIILTLLLDLFLPIVGNVKDVIHLVQEIKTVVSRPFKTDSLQDLWTGILRLLDIPLMIKRTITAILGRTLMLPLLIASFIPHPLVKGIAAAVGYGLLGDFVQGEVANVAHKVLLAKTGLTDDDEKAHAYNSIADSLIALAMAAALAILMLVISVIANVIKGVYNFVKTKFFTPKAEPVIEVPGGTKTGGPVEETPPRNIPEENLQGIKSETNLGDGHKLKYLENGQVYLCSPICTNVTEFTAKYGDFIKNNQALKDELTAIARMTDEAERLAGLKQLEEKTRPLWEKSVLDGPKPARGTPEGDFWRYNRYQKGGGKLSFEDWMKVNKGGRSGGPGHQEIQDRLESQGYETEHPIGDRAADAYKPPSGKNPGEIHQIGGLNKRGDPIARERDAINDILKSPEYKGEDIYFWDKTNPSAPPIKNPQNLPTWGDR